MTVSSTCQQEKMITATPTNIAFNAGFLSAAKPNAYGDKINQTPTRILTISWPESIILQTAMTLNKTSNTPMPHAFPVAT